MYGTLAPLILDGTAASTAQQVSYVAAPIWDIGANVKNQGITFAVYLMMGGTAVVAAFLFFVTRNKTAALKALAVGVVIIGLIGALPSLGVVSKDTFNGLVNSGGTR